MGIFTEAIAVVAGDIFYYYVYLALAAVVNVTTAFVGGFCQISVNFYSVPIVGQFILWSQGIAIVAVIALRVGVGIKDGVLLNGSSSEVSVGEYLFKSVGSIVLVAVMPALCTLVIAAGTTMLADVNAGTGDLTDVAGLNDDLTGHIANDLAARMENTALGGGTSLFKVPDLAKIVLVVACLVLACTVIYQFAKRNVEMTIVSMVAPWVSILAGTENDAAQYWDLLKNLFGMCLTQVVQYVMFLIGCAFLVNYALSSGDALFDTLDSAVFSQLIYTLAIFGATSGIGSLVDRYTFSAARSSYGNLALGMAMRTGASLPRTIATAIKAAPKP